MERYITVKYVYMFDDKVKQPVNATYIPETMAWDMHIMSYIIYSKG